METSKIKIPRIWKLLLILGSPIAWALVVISIFVFGWYIVAQFLIIGGISPTNIASVLMSIELTIIIAYVAFNTRRALTTRILGNPVPFFGLGDIPHKLFPKFETIVGHFDIVPRDIPYVREFLEEFKWADKEATDGVMRRLITRRMIGEKGTSVTEAEVEQELVKIKQANPEVGAIVGTPKSLAMSTSVFRSAASIVYSPIQWILVLWSAIVVTSIFKSPMDFRYLLDISLVFASTLAALWIRATTAFPDAIPIVGPSATELLDLPPDLAAKLKTMFSKFKLAIPVDKITYDKKYVTAMRSCQVRRIIYDTIPFAFFAVTYIFVITTISSLFKPDNFYGYIAQATLVSVSIVGLIASFLGWFYVVSYLLLNIKKVGAAMLAGAISASLPILFRFLVFGILPSITLDTLIEVTYTGLITAGIVYFVATEVEKHLRPREND